MEVHEKIKIVDNGEKIAFGILDKFNNNPKDIHAAMNPLPGMGLLLTCRRYTDKDQPLPFGEEEDSFCREFARVLFLCCFKCLKSSSLNADGNDGNGGGGDDITFVKFSNFNVAFNLFFDLSASFLSFF